LSSSVIDGPHLKHLRSFLIDTLAVEDVTLCGSGSLALEIALRACGVHPGDEIIIPTFCCTAVVSPILAIGALPVLTDVGEELNITAETVEAALTEKTKAIIVPHLFGNPADIKTIIDLAHSNHIRVIDDAAQALGATINGQHMGTFGDAGILSFGTEKVCFGIGGGVLLSRNKEILERCLEFDFAPPQFSTTVRAFFSTMIWRRWRTWTLPVHGALKKNNNPDSPPAPYRKEAMANLNAAVAVTLMQTLRENIAARSARVRAYQELLGGEKRLRLIPHRSGSACLSQVIRVLSRRRGADLSTLLIEVLGSAGYEVQGSYVPIHLLPHYEHWARKHLPHAERIWADLIELPCEPSASLGRVERIAAIVKQVVNT
jgi:dTDP-4-amino-4,6-dideoxygalactose transaminase